MSKENKETKKWLDENYYGFTSVSNIKRKVRTKRSQDDYTRLSDIEHAFRKSGMYIGGFEPNEQNDWVYDFDTKHMKRKDISLSDGILRFYLELISNAANNANETIELGGDPGIIEVEMDDERLTVTSGGMSIPIEIKENGKDDPINLIEMIFGHLRTGSNNDDKVANTGNGVNGMGVKLVNINGRIFIVRAGNPELGVEQISEWSHNMTRHIRTKITPECEWQTGHKKGKKWVKGSWKFAKGVKKYKGPSYVQVSVWFDLRNFGLKKLPKETYGIFARHLIDVSKNCKIPVIFNGQRFDYSNTFNYMKLFFPDLTTKNMMIHYEWTGNKVPEEIANETQPSKIAKIIADSRKANLRPLIEICIFDTPDCEKLNVSFCNGMITPEHGVHVDAVFKELTTHLIPMAWKPSKDDIEKKVRARINMGDIKKNLTIISSCRVPNPNLQGQFKSKMGGPKIPIKFLESDIEKLKKLDIIANLQKIIDLNNNKNFLKKHGGKRKQYLEGVGKLQDANLAGTSKSQDCILFLPEGDSAAGTIGQLILMLKGEKGEPGGKDIYGLLPVQGKIPNISDYSLDQIRDLWDLDKEKSGGANVVARINQAMGFLPNMDYSDPAALDTLRYGIICSCVDGDNDGKHINALLANVLYRLHPTFIANGGYACLCFPIVKVFQSTNKKAKCLARFFTLKEFYDWRDGKRSFKKIKFNYEEAKSKDYDIRNYKGLGTYPKEDLKDDINYIPTLILILDDDADKNFDIVFKKGLENRRKDHLAKWRNAVRVDDIISVNSKDLISGKNISDIFNTEIVDYGIECLYRAIPSYKDHFKDVQRKIMWGTLLKYNYGKSKAKPCTIDLLASFCHEKTAYHHGPESMKKAIMKMIQDYPGACIINYLTQQGSIGSRYALGKDAAAGRYATTRAEKICSLIFDKDLIDLVPRNESDGELKEPKWLPSYLPYFINGSRGIGWAWSNRIPSYHPLDVIEALKRLFKNKKPKQLHPFIKGFKGEITIELHKNKGKNENYEYDEDELEYFEGVCMKTRGVYKVTGSNAKGADIHITELPIGTEPRKYFKKLYEMAAKKDITHVSQNPKDLDTVDIHIKGWKKEINDKTLEMVTRIGIGNIVLIDDEANPLTIKNIGEVLELYYLNMIEHLQLFIDTEIKRIRALIDDLLCHIRLVKLVNDETLKLGQPESKINKILDKNSIPFKSYHDLFARQCNDEEIVKTQKKLDKLKEELDYFLKITPQKYWKGKLNEIEKYIKRNYKELRKK